MEVYQFTDYRAYLKADLESRLGRNPAYSLRAYARDLQIAPQILSSVLKKKKGISTEVGAHLAERLELSPAEASYLVDLVALAHARSPEAKKIAAFRVEERSKQNEYRSLEAEAFRVISDWYHYAILELMQTADFKSDCTWIAARLGISKVETEQAIDRLKQLGFIEEVKHKFVRVLDSSFSANFGAPSAAIRKFTRQVLEKARDALESQSLDERDITTMTMAIDPRRLVQAKKKITKFRRELAEFLEQGERTEVYTFVPALFKVSKSFLKKGVIK